MRIGIVSNINNGKGLQRDYEVLRAELLALGHEVVGIHFQDDRLKAFARFDLLVCLETPAPEFHHLADRCWLIPNPEWLEAGLDIRSFERVLVKTKSGVEALKGRHPNVELIGWSTRDFGPAVEGRSGQFLHIVGGSMVKGTAAVLAAWKKSAPPDARLTIVGQRRVVRGRMPRGVTMKTGITDEELKALYAETAWLIEPSEVEGFGHVFREAMSAGCGVITTNAPPMNEIVCHAEFVPCEEGPRLKSARTWKVNVDALGEAIKRCWATKTDPEFSRASWETGRANWKAKIREVFGMTAPRVSICFPTHKAGVPLLMRSLAALRAQTAPESSFEVCVGADGAKAREAIEGALEGELYPFEVIVAEGERPRGDVPHRNHARNAAWRASSGEICWILDCDFCLEPEAIEHLIHEWDRLRLSPVLPVFSPILVGFGGLGPDHWKRVSRGLLDGSMTAMELANARETDEGIFAGYPERATDTDLGISSEPLPAIMEGQPAVPRIILEGLNGFDEGFGEWGGDKEEFVDRIRGLARADLAELRLLTSTKAWHQPHPRDKGAHTRESGERQQKRRRRASLIQGKSSWWRTQVERVREMVEDYRSRLPVQETAEKAQAVGAVDPVLAREVEKAIARSARRGGNVLVAGEGADSLAAYLTGKGMTATTVVNEGERYCSLVVVGLEPDRLKYLASIVPKGTGFAVLVRTSLSGRGNSNPIVFQRCAHGLAVKGSRRIHGQNMTLMTGRAR